MINQNQVALAKKLLESKGYEVSKKMNESPNYPGQDVSKDLKPYLVTVIIGNSDGDRETGMTEPESYTELVSAMDEDDAKRQVEKGLNPGNGVVDVHLATDEEIAEWESDAYDYLEETHDRKIRESEGTESHEGWEYYEMPKDFKGPWTATQYTKDIDDLYLTIYPPQRVSGTTDEESKDWHAEVERADGKSDPINTYQTGLSSFEEAEKWVNEWIASHKKSMNESADKFKVGDLIVGNESGNFYRVKEITPTHYVCDDLQGHGIAKLFKHRVNRTFSLEESKNPHTEQYKGYSIQSYDDYGATIYKNGKKIREFENIDDAREYIDELNESKKTKSVKVQESRELDYEDMQYWNPVAIGNEIAEYLGVKATEEEIKAELSKIIPDTKSPKFQRALEKALLKIEMDKESMNEDPMQGHKYLVSGNTSNVTETGTDRNIYNGGYTEDPREAIITWLKLSQKAPTSISIDTNKNAAADELLAWVVDNEEEFRDLCAQYKAPYKVDYLVDACKRGNRHDFEKSKYNYPDQVHPFSIG